MGVRPLPPRALQRIKGWMRSRHVVCKGHFLVMESLEQGAIDRFSACVEALGGSLIGVEACGRWTVGNRNLVVLRARASLMSGYWPELVGFWAENGAPYSRFDVRG